MPYRLTRSNAPRARRPAPVRLDEHARQQMTPAASIHSGRTSATVRASSLPVSVSSAAMIHFGPFFASAEPGWIDSLMPRAPW